MKKQIDNIKKEERRYFKEQILNAINGKGNVYFTLDKAIVEIKMPYLVTEETLILKSQYKKAVNKVVNDFRLYQFNNG